MNCAFKLTPVKLEETLRIEIWCYYQDVWGFQNKISAKYIVNFNVDFTVVRRREGRNFRPQSLNILTQSRCWGWNQHHMFEVGTGEKNLSYEGATLMNGLVAILKGLKL